MSQSKFIPIAGDNPFPKSVKLRRDAINKVLEEKEPVEQNRRIPGLDREHDIYEIDIDDLIYNLRNFRFFSDRKTHESEFGEDFHSKDDNRREAAGIAERRIWNQDTKANEKTIDSLLKHGQIEPAVCDLNGVVVSGNRRLTLLHQIKRRRAEGFYKSGVSPARLNELANIRVKIESKQFTDNDIEVFETRLQHTEDNKLDYDPINKYFLVRNLVQKHGKSPQEIYDDNKGMPSLSKAEDVDKFVRVADLMDKYLDFIKCPQIFSQLKGLEDPFRRLDEDLTKIKNRKVQKLGNVNIQIQEYKNAFFLALHAKPSASGNVKEKWYRDFFKGFDFDRKSWNELAKKSHEIQKEISTPQSTEPEKIRESNQEFTDKYSEDIADLVEQVSEEIKNYEKANKNPIDALNRVISQLEDFQAMVEKEGFRKNAEDLNKMRGKIDELYSKLGTLLSLLS